MRIGVLHGPNLNLLGSREPALYGTRTLAEIDRLLAELGRDLGVDVEAYQSNVEGELIDYVQEAATRVAGFVVNAAGYTHTSVALADALAGVARPYVEVHLSNVHAREPVRRESLLAARAAGVIAGLGADSYLLGLRALVRIVRDETATTPFAGETT